MSSAETVQPTRPLDLSDLHEHGWCIESVHATSFGHVLYVRCAACGTRRVDVQRVDDEPPVAASLVVGLSASSPDAADPPRARAGRRSR